jgi:hypothetical protein
MHGFKLDSPEQLENSELRTSIKKKKFSDQVQFSSDYLFQYYFFKIITVIL